MLHILVKIIQFISFIAMLIVDVAVGTLIYYCIEGRDYTRNQLIFMFAMAMCLLYVTYTSFVAL